jgi:PKD repeat protein
MVTVRGSLAKRNAGGPQFKYIPQRIAVEVDSGERLADIAESDDPLSGHLLDTPPVGDDVMGSIESQLQLLDFDTRRLENTGVIIAETQKLTSVIENIKSFNDDFSDSVVNSIDKLESRAKSGESGTILDAFRPGMFNFQDFDAQELEANLRNELVGEIRNPITSAVEEITGVASAQVSYSVNTPGPRNLGVDVLDTELEVTDDTKPHVGDAADKIGAKSAWQINSGENAVVAIFDTSFSRKFLDSDRVIDTFSGQDVESAFSKPEEGHGTMTGYSAAGNSDDTDLVDYDGIAKDADILLARLSDSNGGLAYTEEAWDWLASWIKKLDRPVISNHSYGIPLCSARGQGLCNSIVSNMSAALSKRDDHQAIYAAGNEAQYCGHRLSGVTNAIAGANSKNPNMAIAAFRFDLNGPQTYSSHGFGTCGDKLDNPKPDVGCLLPSIVPYGNSEKDMSGKAGGSNAGTSEAAPITTGAAALVASVVGNAKKEVIEGVLEGTAELPVRTQVNTVLGYDARYGNGQINVDDAIKQAQAFEAEQGPNAVFTYSPSTPTVGTEITFNAEASTDPDEDIVSYEWSFGDGTSASGQTVTHQYDDFGTNTVILTVTDSFGNEDTFSQEVRISGEPQADFTIEPESPTVSEAVRFNATISSDPDGDIESYEWAFGDGSTATGDVVEHEFTSSAVYNVSVRVTDSVGNIDITTKTLNVSASPTAEFTYNPENPIQNQRVDFDATISSDPNNDIEQYRWDFGDGVTSTGPTVRHTFGSSGRFDVTLVVEDSVGNTSTVSQTVNVGATPTAQFTVSPTSPSITDTITLDASPSTDPDDNITSYSWDLGDGRSRDGIVVQTSYNETRSYEITLTVEDSLGNTDTKSRSVTVTGTAEPNADFTINPSNPSVSQTVGFDASPSNHPEGVIESYEWDLGNGETATGQTVQTSYSQSDLYEITLTVTDQQGNTSSITRSVTVSRDVSSQPSPDFVVNPSEPTVEDDIQLDATPTSSPQGDIQSYTWNLGNGETGSGETLTISYDSPNSYRVILTAESGSGQTDSIMKTLTVDPVVDQSPVPGEDNQDGSSDSGDQQQA